MQVYKLMTVLMLLTLTACNQYKEVSVAECPKVAEHASKVLAAMSPGTNELKRQCQKATDSERGCILAAENHGQLAKCM